jgi:hypothetical protein
MDSKRNWLDRPIHPALPAITNEIIIFALVILLIAIATRFYDLGVARHESRRKPAHVLLLAAVSRAGIRTLAHDARSIAIPFDCAFLFHVRRQ